MSSATTSPTDDVAHALARRTSANERFFGEEAERTARLCHAMAERFARGGRLVALGSSPAARSDVRHVAVEFVHPVIVGKRALPAIGLAQEGGALALQARLLMRRDDIVIAYGAQDGDAELLRALAWARDLGCLTVSYARGSGAEWEFEPPSEDPFVRQELAETHYHVLWELVHVFFEHRGLLGGRAARPVHDTGASSFLYPFLAEREHDLEAVVADVRRSIEMKAGEVGALREQTLIENRQVLERAARVLRQCFEAGGKLLALGNGGSATDAMDAVADFRMPPAQFPAHIELPPWPPRPAIDLTEDSAILTAIANDVGTEEIFQRQVIAYGERGDVLLGLSTSGNSGNVIAALEKARKRGLETVAMVGYDGGRVASEGLADHVVITRSQHIPRIQEAQASAYHVLRALVER
ncbi:MAG: SIS domain-containing protein [Solirubrobacterales bacterium]|nr:SIS domain-containing protein [Solirubrobacterales bacterium]